MALDDDLQDIFRKDQGGGDGMDSTCHIVFEGWLKFHTLTDGNIPLTCQLTFIWWTGIVKGMKADT